MKKQKEKKMRQTKSRKSAPTLPRHLKKFTCKDTCTTMYKFTWTKAVLNTKGGLTPNIDLI